ncbi:related to cytidine deaminase [Cephalotrichum gorgonifer]|uniref:Related to cytidine deaminase n=1 Tax=Cephalotrichum gorgonifer TaxID=2041049 RepID=A0AAE8N4W0_9PEZI|nr:related to cytidine deaminase [Cephalotrichum gorgonifer]
MALPVDEALIKTATEALEAVLPNSGNHTVTASVRTRAGASFSGANVYSFTGGPCAELVALGVAAAAGVLAEDITTVVAVKKDAATGEIRVLNPCGRCRQVLFDYNDKLDVIVVDGGKIRTASIRKLLPFAYVTAKEGYD